MVTLAKITNLVSQATQSVNRSSRVTRAATQAKVGHELSPARRHEIGREVIAEYRETLDLLAAHDRGNDLGSHRAL